jgi:protein TonB
MSATPPSNTSVDDDEDSRAKKLLVPGVILFVMAALVLVAVKTMGGKSASPKHQTVKIAVLPDTPPPPPPPPKEEKKPEPEKLENKPQPQEQPKQVEAPPEPQQLKMEGAAGDGPSAFGSGSVNSEYKGGDIGTGSGGVAAPVNRLQFALFTSQLQKHIQAALAKSKDVKGNDYRVNVQVWFDNSGQFRRVDLLTPTGDAALDEAIKQALAQVPAMDGVPSNLPQPVRLRISNRLTG